MSSVPSIHARFAARVPGRALLALVLAGAVVLGAACDDAGGAEPVVISVVAEAVVPGIPVTVSATEPGAPDDEGRRGHSVSVRWDGDERIVLDDSRFTHHVEVGDGHLVTAGRGCGAQWSEEDDDVIQACTDDLQIIRLEPGESHVYPVVIYPEVGPLRLEPGTYTFDEPVRYWDTSVQDGEGFPNGDATGTLTVRVTYVVE